MKRNKIFLYKLSAGEVGVNSFFAELDRSISMVSNSFSHLVFIKREDFVDLIQKYPTDYEKFSLVKD
jgi:hypothetical protein